MSVQLWNISNGQELKKLIENTTVNVLLPVSSSYDIDTEVIAGTLPPGLTLTNNKITGTVQEVQYDTVFKFVITRFVVVFPPAISVMISILLSPSNIVLICVLVVVAVFFLLKL